MFALLTTITATTAATISYLATASRLPSEVDASLQQATAQLQSPRIMLAPGFQPPPGSSGPSGSGGVVGSGSGVGGVVAAPPGSGGAVGSGSGIPTGPVNSASTTSPNVSTASIPPGPAIAGSGVAGSVGISTEPGSPLLKGLFDLVISERIDASGAVISKSNENTSVNLPVTAGDMLIAKNGGSPWLRTENVGGVPFRVITVPTPGGGAILLSRDLSETDQVLGSLRIWFGLLDLFVTLVAAAAGWLIARRISAPLTRLTATAEGVAANGDLEGTVETNRRDEIGRLARAFTSMLGALARSRQQQHQLVHDAGHELRTPLTSIRNNVNLLTRYPDLPPETRDALLSDLDSELQELTNLVDEIVSLATDSHDDEATTSVDMENLATRLAERMEKRTGRRVTVSSEPWVVTGRAKALERAVSNLVDNAAKFSPRDAPIEVVVRPGNLEVRDHGNGIDADDLPYVFERFYRASAARSQPGSGLGLSIVRQIVEDHGGRVFARNLPGGGAAVGLELPSNLGG